jgi:protein-S-isoprenylcysteine O-methyltransferase Ste14
VGVVLIATSGRWDWAMAWLLVGIYAATLLAQLVLLLPRRRDLLADRAVRMGAGTKSWDRALLPACWLAALAVLVVAGLDVRLGWSHRLPVWFRLTGFGLALAGNGLVTWAMVANAFFAFSVRLQPDRGQTVATGGPYRAVRHPGYLGASVSALGTALLLGSSWSLLPAVASVALRVVRAWLEDRALAAELDGYADYARVTRYRLLPGVW